ncbi:MAG: hypothetical protein ACRBI6_19685 [Acidimicrobiales bacterium]
MIIFLELLIVLAAGVGGLVAHELGHAAAHRVWCGPGSRRVSIRATSIVVEVDPEPIGLPRCGVAIAGPATGAVVPLALTPLTITPGVLELLAALHLAMLLPLFVDGRHLLRGAAEARRQLEWSTRRPSRHRAR